MIKPHSILFPRNLDGIPITTDIYEAYGDSGALFKVSDITKRNVDKNGSMIYELQSDYDEIRIFHYYLRTLSSEYRVCIHEVSKRDISNGTTPLTLMSTNRINIKDSKTKIAILNGDLTRQEGDGPDDYNDSTRIDCEYYIGKENIRPNQLDPGTDSMVTTAIKMNTKDYNYLMVVRNYDQDKDYRGFFHKTVFGIPDLLK